MSNHLREQTILDKKHPSLFPNDLNIKEYKSPVGQIQNHIVVQLIDEMILGTYNVICLSSVTPVLDTCKYKDYKRFNRDL